MAGLVTYPLARLVGSGYRANFFAGSLVLRGKECPAVRRAPSLPVAGRAVAPRALVDTVWNNLVKSVSGTEKKPPTLADVAKEDATPAALIASVEATLERPDEAAEQHPAGGQEAEEKEDTDSASLAVKEGEGPSCTWHRGYNYGFQAQFISSGPTVPSNVISLAVRNFRREFRALRRNVLYEELEAPPDLASQGVIASLAFYSSKTFLSFLKGADRVLTLLDGLPEITPSKPLAEDGGELRQGLQQLTLSDAAVWEREHARPQVEAPIGILIPYYLLCTMLDVIFANRPIQRFWFLETVARMPYFSYISMLHLYETLGWWRVGAEVRKVHFAEEWNEMNHLRIMESLGGDRLWIDRFFAQHAAFFYYWILNFMFLASPKVAYNFSELVEMHAVDTYSQFVDENESRLKSLPPSPAALQYYMADDLYMFDEFQTSQQPESRRPKIESLYDVFCAIRDDEKEHVKTMVACQQLDTVIRSPNRSRQL